MSCLNHFPSWPCTLRCRYGRLIQLWNELFDSCPMLSRSTMRASQSDPWAELAFIRWIILIHYSSNSLWSYCSAPVQFQESNVPPTISSEISAHDLILEWMRFVSWLDCHDQIVLFMHRIWFFPWILSLPSHFVHNWLIVILVVWEAPLSGKIWANYRKQDPNSKCPDDNTSDRYGPALHMIALREFVSRNALPREASLFHVSTSLAMTIFQWIFPNADRISLNRASMNFQIRQRENL